ncbi:unnamed protein product [Auanema sp. JU1783]|nr:unnamed protein product [Auanema sp. JU1783]
MSKRKTKAASLLDLWQKQVVKVKTSSEIITLGDDSLKDCTEASSCSSTPKQTENKCQTFSRTPTSFYSSHRSTPGSNKVLKLKKHDLAGLVLDETNASTIVFPIKEHIRCYEFNLVKSCIALNTCICLPFNVSTNFIISTVFINFSRWFPDSKLVYCYTTVEEGQDFVEICKANNISNADITLIPVYQNFKKLIAKNARIIVTSVQCMIKVVENEPEFCNKIQCLALQMDAGESVMKQKKIVGPLVTSGITFRIIVSLPSSPDGSRRTSSISRRQQLITSLLVSQWEELSGLDRLFRCDAVPLGLSSVVWNGSDLSSEVKYIMENLCEILKPLLQNLQDHFHVSTEEISEIFNFRFDLFGDSIPSSMRKDFDLGMFFFEVYRYIYLFGPRALWLFMTDFLNNELNCEKAEQIQLFILSTKKISRIFDQIQNDYSNFIDAPTNGQKVLKSHIKFLLIRDQLISWINSGIPTNGVILCHDMATARCITESLIGLENATVRLVSDEAYGLNIPNISVLPITRISGIFHESKNVIIVLPLSLSGSLSALDTFTSNGLRFVIATERRSICLLEHDVANNLAFLDESFEKLRSSDGRLARKAQEPAARRSLVGREGVVNRYDFKFEESRLVLSPDLFTVVPLNNKTCEEVTETKKIAKRKLTEAKPEHKANEYLSEGEMQEYQQFVGYDAVPKYGEFSKRRALGVVYPVGSYSNITFQAWSFFNRQDKFPMKTLVGETLIRILRDEESNVMKKRRNFNYDTSSIDKEKIQMYKTLIDELNVYWNKV